MCIRDRFNTELGLLNKWLTALGFAKVDFLANNGVAFISCMALNLSLIHI